MAFPSRQPVPFRVGEWLVDPSTGQLTRGSEVRRARPLVADLLLYLAARPGEVVSKEELVAGPWGGAAIADSALTSTIAELRELLDDQPKAPIYIQTLPKRGYRLIAAVASASDEPRITTLAPDSGESPTVQAGPPEAPIPRPTEPTSPRAFDPLTVQHPGWSRRSWTVAFILGILFAGVMTFSLASRYAPADTARAADAPARAMRLTVNLPDGVRLGPDTFARLALSADGSRVAYVVRDRDQAGTILYVRALDQYEAQPIAGTHNANAPFFSPDGSRIGFFADGEVRVVPVSGGQPTVVCGARAALGASWGADGTIVFSGAHGQGLWEVAATGGEPRPLTELDKARGELSHRWPQVLPGGRVLFTAIGKGRADVILLARGTGTRHVVVEHAQTARFVAPDKIMFERSGRLSIAPVDPERFVLTGDARVIASDLVVAGPGFGSPAFDVASGGALVYVPVDPHETERELVWVDRGGRATPLGTPVKSYMHPRLSPDERQILTWMRTSDPDLWIVDIASRGLTRLASGVPGHRAAWSPDGKRVMFDGPGADNPVTLYEADVRVGEARRLRSDRNSQYAGEWTPDGRTIVYQNLTIATGFDIVAMGNEPSSPAVPLLAGKANETAPAFSPNGGWLAFVWDVTGREEVYLVPYPVSGAPVQVSTDGGREPIWSKRGDELFYRKGPGVWSVRLGVPPRVSEPQLLFSGEYDMRPAARPSYDVAADGRFLMIRGTAPPAADRRIAVLLRWDGQ
jgi:eukaryotic-like serine/threonine-protein kinase